MDPNKIAKTFLILMSLFLLCTSSATAEDQVPHQTGIINELKNNFNTLYFYGGVLLSEASYKINNPTNINEDEDNVTTQDDLDFWISFQAQYPFSEKPVFINADNISAPVYSFLPEGISEITVMDNSGNALDSYIVTKNETGFTIQKTIFDNPDQSYTITLNKLEELEEIYGNMKQFQAFETYVVDQIHTQA
jgi:hypothetical protein